MYLKRNFVSSLRDEYLWRKLEKHSRKNTAETKRQETQRKRDKEKGKREDRQNTVCITIRDTREDAKDERGAINYVSQVKKTEESRARQQRRRPPMPDTRGMPDTQGMSDTRRIARDLVY